MKQLRYSVDSIFKHAPAKSPGGDKAYLIKAADLRENPPWRYEKPRRSVTSIWEHAETLGPEFDVFRFDPETIKEYALKSFDVLLCITGRAGDIGLLGNIRGFLHPCLANGQIAVLRFYDEDISARREKAIALYMYLRSAQGRRSFIKIVQEGKNSIRTAKKTALEEWRIPELDRPALLNDFEICDRLGQLAGTLTNRLIEMQDDPGLDHGKKALNMARREFAQALRKGRRRKR